MHVYESWHSSQCAGRLSTYPCVCKAVRQERIGRDNSAVFFGGRGASVCVLRVSVTRELVHVLYSVPRLRTRHALREVRMSRMNYRRKRGERGDGEQARARGERG